MKNKHLTSRKRKALALMMMIPLFGFSQQAASSDTYFSNPLFNTLLVVIIILAIMIVALSGALKNIFSSDMYVDKLKKNLERKSNQGKTGGMIVLLALLSSPALAQGSVDKISRIGGLDLTTFYTMMVIIGAELLALGVLFQTFKKALAPEKEEEKPVEADTAPKGKTILDRLNDTVEIENEESILLDHDYDGIRELDNNLPPWWKYGFYLTIIISVIYLINFHVTKTSPLQAEEYKRSIKKAEVEVAEYLKNSANNVDENTVKMLTDPADLTAGKDLFVAACSPCHGKLGEGTVGPNLTDDYWLHGGSVKDIFKTIKYGWPDKGMKAWKDDYSPIQIAQITSYIRSLKGTNPPKAKDKQGDLYVEQAVTDSLATRQDTVRTLSSADTQSK